MDAVYNHLWALCRELIRHNGRDILVKQVGKHISRLSASRFDMNLVLLQLRQLSLEGMKGLTAHICDSGIDFIGKPADYGQKVREEWTANRYHKPADVVRPDWDMTGTREDLKVYFAVGYRVAQADKIPEWKPGNEFKAKRDAMLKK